ncbi:MAG TPA: 4Fe-4S binding protein [Epulopiscium sp.]|nr:4Fe-4S binding protein [Candidatus Epulonipiscium sp.]
MTAPIISLPTINELGFYEIRLESVGGLGANLSGKILGEIGALQLGLNSSSFASYGSEKKGTPVKSFIRWCDPQQEIRISTPITEPHLLGLFHEALAGKVAVTAGVTEKTAVVINSVNTPDEVRDRLKLYAGKVYCVDALKIAIEEKTRVNMVMLGALAKASGFIPLEAIEEAVENAIGKKYPAALAGNLRGVKRGYDEITMKEFAPDDKYEYVKAKEVQYEWGWDNAPIGGLNPHVGSMIANDMLASREGFVPKFIKEKCINCGLCDSTCPDMVYQFVPGEYRNKPAMVNLGPDYHHCKGCLRCVEICPVAALVAVEERDFDELWDIHIRNQEIIVDKMEFEEVGSNAIVDTQSDQNEVQMEEGGAK